MSTPTITLNVVVPESLNRPALDHNDYGVVYVDSKLKDYKNVEESSARDVSCE